MLVIMAPAAGRIRGGASAQSDLVNTASEIAGRGKPSWHRTELPRSTWLFDGHSDSVLNRLMSRRHRTAVEVRMTFDSAAISSGYEWGSWVRILPGAPANLLSRL